LAAELKEAFDIEPTLIQGHSGVYDVTVDGDLVFSKYAEGRHAEDGEVVALLRARANPA